VLTHKDLHLHPVAVRLHGETLGARRGSWMAPEQFGSLGLPAPIQRLLASC
jgi:A/G-specific adenine glycosylase